MEARDDYRKWLAEARDGNRKWLVEARDDNRKWLVLQSTGQDMSPCRVECRVARLSQDARDSRKLLEETRDEEHVSASLPLLQP